MKVNKAKRAKVKYGFKRSWLDAKVSVQDGISIREQETKPSNSSGVKNEHGTRNEGSKQDGDTQE